MSIDSELIRAAETFVKEFQAALVKSEQELLALVNSLNKGFATGTHGTVEFTDALIEALRKLTARAVKVFGASRIHQKTVEEVARSVAFSSDQSDSLKTIAKSVAIAISNAATCQLRLIRPNRLFSFIGETEDINIGPVRITTRELIREEIEGSASSIRITPPVPEKCAFTLIQFDKTFETHIHLPEICWDVSVQGMPRGVDLQALWYIDVAISFVRLHYKGQTAHFPKIADIEPHPIFPHSSQSEGLSIGPNGPAYGAINALPCYEIDTEIINTLNSDKVVEVAKHVFNPESNTLAERMQQALGWLTRARRAQEPAERVLFFFTTIEALLSGASKDGPVAETIARYAGVIWSEKPDTRQAVYASLKKHYDLRSRIVHNGERSVAQIEVNNIHYIAWTITQNILRTADLTVRHSDFIANLKGASFGTKLDL